MALANHAHSLESSHFVDWALWCVIHLTPSNSRLPHCGVIGRTAPGCQKMSSTLTKPIMDILHHIMDSNAHPHCARRRSTLWVDRRIWAIRPRPSKRRPLRRAIYCMTSPLHPRPAEPLGRTHKNLLLLGLYQLFLLRSLNILTLRICRCFQPVAI